MHKGSFSYPHCFNSIITMKFSTNFEFWYQIKAMTIRNILIKRRDIKKTLAVSTFDVINK